MRRTRNELLFAAGDGVCTKLEELSDMETVSAQKSLQARKGVSF